eukprot:IDg14632t1
MDPSHSFIADSENDGDKSDEDCSSTGSYENDGDGNDEGTISDDSSSNHIGTWAEEEHVSSFGSLSIAPENVAVPSPLPDGPTSSKNITRRYPTRERKPPDAWWSMVVQEPNDFTKQVTVTTSDEPPFRETMSATPDERAMWADAISDEMASLETKGTWILDSTPSNRTLPTHVVLKVKLHGDG